MSDIDTQSQNSTVFCHQDLNFQGLGTRILIWLLERGSDQSTFSTHTKYLKSVHLKMSTCCSKTLEVVLSFNAHYQNFEYNSTNPRKFQVEVYPNHIHFPVKVHANPRIFRRKTTQNWRTSPSCPMVKHSPPRQCYDSLFMFHDYLTWNIYRLQVQRLCFIHRVEGAQATLTFNSTLLASINLQATLTKLQLLNASFSKRNYPTKAS